MTRPVLGLITLVSLCIPACEPVSEPDPPTIENKSADEAAVLTTEIACDYVERCGLVEITCVDCAEGQDCGGCVAERREVELSTCIDDLQPDLEAGFGCETLTPEEQALVDECLGLLPATECASLEEIEAWANGGGGAQPQPVPEACDLVEDIRYRCAGGDSQVPTPG